jgi:hypothetical protein
MARVQVTCFKLFDTVPNKGPKKEKKEAELPLLGNQTNEISIRQKKKVQDTVEQNQK